MHALESPVHSGSWTQAQVNNYAFQIIAAFVQHVQERLDPSIVSYVPRDLSRYSTRGEAARYGLIRDLFLVRKRVEQHLLAAQRGNDRCLIKSVAIRF